MKYIIVNHQERDTLINQSYVQYGYFFGNIMSDIGTTSVLFNTLAIKLSEETINMVFISDVITISIVVFKIIITV